MRSERLAIRRRDRKAWFVGILVFILASVGLGIGTFSPAGSAQRTVTACFDSNGKLESQRVALQPLPCAHPWDRRFTWTVTDYVPPTTTTTTTLPTTTTNPVVTTTVPTTVPSTTTQPTGSNSPPVAGGFFQFTPPGTAFPTEASCATSVHHSTWEPRPENNVANRTAPVHPEQLANFSQWSTAWNQNYKPRITGNFQGTTDEIIQWAACKWGWSDDVIRAEAITESSWRQSTAGDGGNSFGLLQIKWNFHPAGPAKGAVGSSWPNSTNSTAYAVDQHVAEMRGCYDGMSTYLGNITGDVWGCLQSWFSGAWTPGGGAYANGVKAHFNNKDWLKPGF